MDYAKARIDQERPGPSLSQVATLYDGHSMDPSQVSSRLSANGDSDKDDRSLASATTSSSFTRQEAGRSYNVLNDTYFLPTDDDEFVRLNKQHLAVVLALSGLYPAPDIVHALLAPREGVQQRILDVGCGTGAWVLSMAKEFPHAHVVGIDLAPVPVSDTLPPNVTFELDDVNKGLTHLYDKFDLVHVRFVATGLRDFDKCKAEIERCLKPGGLAIWIDADYDMLSSNKDIYRPPAIEGLVDNGSWVARMFFETRRIAVQLGGSSLFAVTESLSRGLWDDKLLDPNTCGRADFFLPIGPWITDKDPVQSQRLSHIGSLMRQDFMSGYRAFHPALQRVGIPAETCEKWSNRADEELNTMKDPIFVRIACAWGRRRASPHGPAPELPSPSNKDPTSSKVDATLSNSSFHANTSPVLPLYPHMEIHTTKAAALEAYERRNRSKTFTTPPLPPGLQL